MPHNYKSGLGNSAAYMVSGTPWITGSVDVGAGQEVKIEFPRVTNNFRIFASASNGDATPVGVPRIRVHFNSTSSAVTLGNNGMSHGPGSPNVITQYHYLQLDGDEESYGFSVKCKEVYITAISDGSGFQCVASLTGIGRDSMYELTGSGLTTKGNPWDDSI